MQPIPKSHISAMTRLSVQCPRQCVYGHNLHIVGHPCAQRVKVRLNRQSVLHNSETGTGPWCFSLLDYLASTSPCRRCRCTENNIGRLTWVLPRAQFCTSEAVPKPNEHCMQTASLHGELSGFCGQGRSANSCVGEPSYIPSLELGYCISRDASCVVSPQPQQMRVDKFDA